MKLSQSAIKRLLTKEEAEFISGLGFGRIEKITPARLRQKLGRARRLRDKYRDLARRQAAEARGKVLPRGSRRASGNDNTMRKVQVFEWAAERITKQLEALEDKNVERGRSERVREAREYSLENVQARVVDVLRDSDTLSFGDLWAAMPDVPVDHLRKALWVLSEAGSVQLTDDAGVSLVSEGVLADSVDLEVDVDKPRPDMAWQAKETPRGRSGKAVPGAQGHHPNIRIRGHVKSSGRRTQARRDRRN